MTKNYEVSPPPGGPVRRDMHQTQAQYPLVVEELLPEEREFFKKCVYGTIIKNGVPFAVFFHYVTKFSQNKVINQITPKHSLMRTFAFFGNVIFGSLIFSPLCVQKLKLFHEENKKIRKEMLGVTDPAAEGSSTSSVSEDFSYPSDLISSLNEPESSFSSDFSSSNLLYNEEERKLLNTTYEDLRTQHRNSTTQSKKPSSQLNIEPEHELDPLSAPIKPSTINEPALPRRITKRNKYGDEME